MLAVVPQLSPDGFVHAVEAEPTVEAVAVLPDGESWCRIDVPQAGRILIAGRMHIRPTYTDLYLGLTGDETVVYDGLSFGFQWGEVADQWPPSNQRYIQSDQKWILVARIQHPADEPTTLTVWAEDHGERVEAEWTFTTPRPVQPFPSWSWDGSAWQPPVPFPVDEPAEGFYWRWDEAGQQWVEESIP